METFADYILNEKDYMKKLGIMYFLEKKADVFFDNSVVFKTSLAKMFMEHAKLDMDENQVLTACLLCGCKKSDNPQDFSRVQSYAKEGAAYLAELGFSSKFCKICEEQNRYSGSEPREKESDILELVDQFGGMLLHRPERMGFAVDEALCLLEHRNLKGKDNRYLEQFKDFVEEMEHIKVNGKGAVTEMKNRMNLCEKSNTKAGMEVSLECMKSIEVEQRRNDLAGRSVVIGGKTKKVDSVGIAEAVKHDVENEYVK